MNENNSKYILDWSVPGDRHTCMACAVESKHLLVHPVQTGIAQLGFGRESLGNWVYLQAKHSPRRFWFDKQFAQNYRISLVKQQKMSLKQDQTQGTTEGACKMQGVGK